MSSWEHELKDEEFRHYQRAFKNMSNISGGMLAVHLARVLWEESIAFSRLN